MADRQAAPFDVWGDLDDFVTFTVRQLRDRGMSHDEAMALVRANIARAHGVLIAAEATDDRDLEVFLLDAGTNIEVFARQAMRARKARAAS